MDVCSGSSPTEKARGYRTIIPRNRDQFKFTHQAALSPGWTGCGRNTGSDGNLWPPLVVLPVSLFKGTAKNRKHGLVFIPPQFFLEFK